MNAGRVESTMTWLVLGIVCSLVVAACGGDNGAPTTQATAATAATTPDSEPAGATEAAPVSTEGGVDATTEPAASLSADLDFIFAHGIAEDSYRDLGAHEVRSYLEEHIAGDVNVQVRPNFGAEQQILEDVQLGSVEMSVLSVPLVVASVPEVGIFDMPYIWRDVEHFFAVTDSGLGLELAEGAEEEGYIVLNFWIGGIRHVYGNVRVDSPEDLEGVKIRILGTPPLDAAFKAFGAIPTPVAFPEVYQALQLGTVDAAETALPVVIQFNQQEVTQYVTLTGHGISATAAVVNADWWNSLDSQVQVVIQDALEAGKLVDREAYLEEDEAALGFLSDQGIEIIEPDRDAFREIALETYPQFYDVFGEDMIQEVLEFGQ